MTFPPQVIKRGDEYVVHNLDLSQLTYMQRLVVAIEIWDQVRELMEINGEYKPRDPTVFGVSGIGSVNLIDKTVGAATGVAWSQINRLRPKLAQRPDIMARMAKNEFATFHEVARTIGMQLKQTLAEGRPAVVTRPHSYYGKGDKFGEAVEPITRYLQAWRKKDFLYAHVPPRVAKKRINQIDEVMGDLARVREDLMQRSHVATLSAPSEKKGRH